LADLLEECESCSAFLPQAYLSKCGGGGIGNILGDHIGKLGNMLGTQWELGENTLEATKSKTKIQTWCH